MARSGITYEDVQTACETIIDRGEGKVTLASVRAELGTGSNSTINKHVRKWREEYRQRIQSIRAKIGVSDDFILAMQNEIGLHLDAQKKNLEERLAASEDEAKEASLALEEAEGIIEKQRVDIAEQQQELNGKISRRDLKVAGQQSVIDEKEKQVNVLQEKHDQVLKKSLELEKENAVAQSRIKGLEEQLTQLADLQKTISEKDREIKELREKAFKLDKELAMAQAQVKG